MTQEDVVTGRRHLFCGVRASGGGAMKAGVAVEVKTISRSCTVFSLSF